MGGTEAMVDTDLEDTEDTMASVRLMPNPRPKLSRTTDTVDTEATVVDTEAMVDTVTAGATMASVRPMPRLRLLLSRTTDMVDMEATVVDTEAMVVMVLDTAGVTTASVRLTPSPTKATEDTEATGATVVTMVATTASVRPRLSPTMAMV